MATEIIMPALGVAQEKGTLLSWLKAEGQSVTKGEPLMEIETDKATLEIEAPASGVLTQVTAAAGDEVPVGQRIAMILAPGEEATPAPLQDPHPRPLPAGKGRGEDRPGTSTLARPTEPRAATPSVGRRLLASPAAKRIAHERAVDLAALQGSGPGGSILAEDVLRAVAVRAPQPEGKSTAAEVTRLSPMRRIVGQRMTQSKQSAPHFYISVEIDMSAVNKTRADWKSREGERVPSINDFILQACARTLKDFPSLNSSYTEHGIQLHSEINIGTAVALEEGLVVPVIRNADRLSLTELARQSRELIEKAQKKKLFPLDYEGGTFTVSNLGMLGVDSFIAIINPPQCAILAVGSVAQRVVADRNQVVIRPMMTATLSADHRIVDGAGAARFLQAFKGLLERPEF